MKRNTLYSHHSTVAADRLGVTMVEVLMSLMIMSIGIASVAVLFPIAVLRSIQATQLTNAAILKSNAESMIDANKQLIFDPDGDGNLREHVGRPEELNYIVDPSGYFEIAQDTTFPTPYSASWTLSAGNNPALPNDSTLRGGADWFGNLDTNADGIPEPFALMPRYDGGVRGSTRSLTYPGGFNPLGGTAAETQALRLLASSLTKLGDAWDTQYDGVPEEFVLANGTTAFPGDPPTAFGAAIVGVKFPVDADLSAIPTATSMVPRIAGTQIISDPETCRAVIFSADGNFSAALPLIAVDDGSKFAVWSEDVDFDSAPAPALPAISPEDLNRNASIEVRTLPPQFCNPVTGFFEIGRVLLQTSRTHDYNWLLTVRRGRDGQARGVDVVVTHNKGITADDERLYSARFVPGSFTVEMILDGGLTAGLDTAYPALRRGGYLLDVTNARWYRIANYREEKGITIGTATGDGYVISLETSVGSAAPIGKAMFLPGVIDVYPMGSVTIPENL
jgi:type II secretory pathway pseudopilin PulG